MEHTFKINIEEITDFKSVKENQRLIDHILCNMNYEDYKTTIKNRWQDILDAEEEFDNRLEIVNALKLLISKY